MKILTLLLFMTFQHHLAAADWKSVPEFKPSHPCHAELVVRCTDKPVPTKQNFFECLTRQMNTLNPACKAFVVKELSDYPCIKDWQKLCPGEKQNRFSFFYCLQKQPHLLSKTCRAHVDKITKHNVEAGAKLTAACLEDQKKFCPNTKTSMQRDECMRNAYRSNTLSPKCRDTIHDTLGPKQAH